MMAVKDTDAPVARTPWGSPEEVGAALRAMRKGKRLDRQQIAWLLRFGLIANDAGNQVLTAKGRHLLNASVIPGSATDAAVGGVFRLPDALDRLASPRKGEHPLVEPCDLAAARRFQSDLQRAGLRQRVTQSWSISALSHGGSRGARGPSREPDTMLDARDRIHRACQSIGPDFAGVLVDVCLLEKTFTGLETERRWPKRSAKLVVALGLRALARHYGLAQTASGVAPSV